MDVLEKIERALGELSRVCLDPRKNFKMCVPVREDDTDVIITAALISAKDNIEAMQGVVDAAVAADCDLNHTGECLDANKDYGIDVQYDCVCTIGKLWEALSKLDALNGEKNG